MSKYLSTTEVAKIIRKELAANFPGIKFSVKSKVYAGGSSIRVGYTDGPAYNKVNDLVRKFNGASFDGMIDLKSYNDDIEYNGEMISLGVDYIFVDRNASDETFKGICLAIAEKYGAPEPVFGGGTENERLYVKVNQYDSNYTTGSIHTEFHREFVKWDAADGMVNSEADLPSIKEYEKDMEKFIQNGQCIESNDFKENIEMLSLYHFDEQVKKSTPKTESWKVW